MARLDPADLLVYVIVDPSYLGERDIADVAETILESGVRALQLRHKGASREDLLAEAVAVRKVTARHGALFIVNDHLDIALESGADGLHVGPDDLAVSHVRERAPGLIVGASAGSPDRAVALQIEGADYLGCGAIWSAHASKQNASAPRGLAMIESVSSAVDIPIVGIGGVTIERAPAVIRAGAAGAAVIRAVLGAPNPGIAATQLVEACRAASS